MSEIKEDRWICTKHYRCGRYRFTAYLPVIGRSDDQEHWRTSVDGNVLPANFDSLEDAMRAALAIPSDHVKDAAK